MANEPLQQNFFPLENRLFHSKPTLGDRWNGLRRDFSMGWILAFRKAILAIWLPFSNIWLMLSLVVVRKANNPLTDLEG